MKQRLHEELLGYGWTKGADAFRDIVWRVFKRHYSDLTDEQLLQEPAEAAKFCDRVRTRAKGPEIPDQLILRTLLNIRKRGVHSL